MLESTKESKTTPNCRRLVIYLQNNPTDFAKHVSYEQFIATLRGEVMAIMNAARVQIDSIGHRMARFTLRDRSFAFTPEHGIDLGERSLGLLTIESYSITARTCLGHASFPTLPPL
eukprot:2853429-Amphidinium_carterae.1